MSLEYDAARPLFIAPEARLSIDQASQALDQCYQTKMPVLIYLHGRAKGVGEPKKSLESGIYRELAAYGVAVLGFTWDADDGGYDENRPIASCGDFAKLLTALRGYLDTHNVARPALLAHSMGNIIIAESAKDNLLTADVGLLFSNLVLTSAAVKTKRHARWLDNIGAAERIYVSINEHDLVLSAAGFAFRPNMLGCDLRPPGSTSARVSYVDVSACRVNHRYFVPQGQEKKASLATLYRQLVTGSAVDFSGIAKPGDLNGIGVQRLMD